MTEEILINVTPQETRVAVIQQGVVQELHVERIRRAAWSATSTWGASSRVLPGMQSAFIDIGCDRAAFLHVADIWEHRQDGEDAKPIEKLLAEGQQPAGAGRSRIRSAPRARGSPRRSASPAASWSISRRNRTSASPSASRTRPSATSCASDCSSCSRPEDDGRLHHPHHGGNRERPETALRHRIPAQDLERHPGKGHARERPRAAVPGPQPQPARAARLRERRNRAHSGRFARNISEAARLRRRTTCSNFASAFEHYLGRAPAVRSVRRRGRDRARAGAAGRSEIRRLSDHRPDRSADHRRRQHRRLRRRAQLRRHHLQDQSGSGAGHRAPAAPAQPGRHHHHRLHRHG